MPLRIPDWYRIECRHTCERFLQLLGGGSWRDRLNENPLMVTIVTVMSLAVLGLVVLLRSCESEPRQMWQVKQAWFYDVNTGKLFLESNDQVGPIEVPSGALDDGTPAGFRAHVYSYVLEPNQSELFVGFLECPVERKQDQVSSQDMENEIVWTKTRLIKRVEDEEWVRASSHKGQDLLESMSRPNAQGQTPIYQQPQ